LRKLLCKVWWLPFWDTVYLVSSHFHEQNSQHPHSVDAEMRATVGAFQGIPQHVWLFIFRNIKGRKNLGNVKNDVRELT